MSFSFCDCWFPSPNGHRHRHLCPCLWPLFCYEQMTASYGHVDNPISSTYSLFSICETKSNGYIISWFAIAEAFSATGLPQRAHRSIYEFCRMLWIDWLTNFQLFNCLHNPDPSLTNIIGWLTQMCSRYSVINPCVLIFFTMVAARFSTVTIVVMVMMMMVSIVIVVVCYPVSM